MINLFNINQHSVNTYNFTSLLHDRCVSELEEKIADFVGAKYAVSLNSATSAIFLSLLNLKTKITIPSIIPPVVANAVITSGNKLEFNDDIEWVGHSYCLYKADDYSIIDSAQELSKNQFANHCNPNDLLIFSFYPTKPLGGCDGGMIVSNDYNKICQLRTLSFNGTTFSSNNWDRKIKAVGYKMYMNSIQAEIIKRNFYSYTRKLDKLQCVCRYYNKNLNLKNSSNHLYRIHVKDNKKFLSYMKSNQVQCGIHYPALHKNALYCANNINLPLSEREAETAVSIPYHESLTLPELEKITELINNYDEHI